MNLQELGTGAYTEGIKEVIKPSFAFGQPEFPVMEILISKRKCMDIYVMEILRNEIYYYMQEIL